MRHPLRDLGAHVIKDRPVMAEIVESVIEYAH
jgi:hypothetical protein